MKPTIGRIIHATVRTISGELVTRPAIIVRAWEDDLVHVNAQVFTDGDGGPANDGLPNCIWVTSLKRDLSSVKSENSWDWPVRELPSVKSGVKSECDRICADVSTLCNQIEQLPASELQTTISLHAADIRRTLSDLSTLL